MERNRKAGHKPPRVVAPNEEEEEEGDTVFLLIFFVFCHHMEVNFVAVVSEESFAFIILVTQYNFKGCQQTKTGSVSTLNHY